MADAQNLKVYVKEELFFQDLNDQNDHFVARINERVEAADCVSTNTANKIVKRDASGNFAAGTITADLTGNVTGNVTGNADTATTSTSLAGGAAGSIPYQTAENTTAFLAKGTLGQVLVYGVLTESGDAANQLSDWKITGATDENTNAGVLYWKLTNSDTTRTVELYKNSDGAAGNKVAAGSRSGNGRIVLTETNDSGIFGEVVVAYSADDADLVNNTLTIEAKPAWSNWDDLSLHGWVEPGDNILLEALTARSSDTNHQIIKTFQLSRPGRYRITFELANELTATSSAYVTTESPYLALTDTATHDQSSYVAKTLDMKIAIGPNSIIHVWLGTDNTDGDHTAYIRNVRVKYQEATPVNPLVVTD